jgi:hypothetical protein
MESVKSKILWNGTQNIFPKEHKVSNFGFKEEGQIHVQLLFLFLDFMRPNYRVNILGQGLL